MSINIIRLLGGLLLFIGFSHILPAQSLEFVEFTAQAPLTLSTDADCNLSLRFQIKKPYHIQAAVVKEESLIPTQISMQAVEGVRIGKPIFPQAEAFYMKGVEAPLYVYSNELEVLVPLKVLDNLLKGNYLLQGVLSYQTCDDFKCYFPRELPFKVELKVH